MDMERGEFRTRVHVFPQDGQQEHGAATLDRRGNLLVINYVRRHRIVSEFLSIRSTSRMARRRWASDRFIRFLLAAIVVLALMMAAMFLLPEAARGTIVSASLILLLGTLAAAMLSLLIPHRTAALFINIDGQVETRTIRHVPGKDELLDTILQPVPVIRKKHEHEGMPGPAVSLTSDWLAAFPLRFLVTTTLVTYVALYSLLGILADLLEWFGIEETPNWMLWLLPLPLVCAAGYTVWQLFRGKGAFGQRARRRQAIRAFGDGNFRSGEEALAELLAEDPEDIEARHLLAHACIASGRYDAAEACIALIPESHAQVREDWFGLLAILEAMEWGKEPAPVSAGEFDQQGWTDEFDEYPE